jgi:type II secretory pathway pseudopilin PulG
VSREVVGRVGGVAGVAALVAGVLIRRHARRAVGRANLTPAVTADPPELAGPTLDELIARRHAGRAVGRANLTPAVTADPPEPAGPTLDELIAGSRTARRRPSPGDKFDVMTCPEAEAIDEVDPWLVDLAAPTEDQQQRRGQRRAWRMAWLLLGGSIVVVIIGIVMSFAIPGASAAADRAQAQIANLNKQIASINNQIDRAPHAKADLAAATKCNQPTGDQETLTTDEAYLNCIAKADPTIAKNMQTLFTDQLEVQGANLVVQGDNFNAHVFELGGPAVLAFGSALSGAVLGWMLTQWFAGFSRP